MEIVDSARVTLSGEGISLVPVNRGTSFTIHTNGAGSDKLNVDIAGECFPLQASTVNLCSVSVSVSGVFLSTGICTEVRYFWMFIVGNVPRNVFM